ncbi:hypothetical protein CNMCM6805_009386 [Aspergillus fumigatiaffinis]|jgi:hypothetical protein|uniref:Uncharacterized protein n=1 Tax=Aspergillus fumigatiaffinis TaxID=340414 RepID=A0A8H4H2G6_9EURO|nr:hypothetical protein CNMCM6805_009386 [Aspergillus fumigatiaffinis]KAF4237086.1 hypothetical protein CNMCM6457_001696 [Aspergillus fumigatiaffinis]
MQYPWASVRYWQPFRIDALGLITLLGAEDINVWVGRLSQSKFTEYMPFLAGFIIAGDRFRIPNQSFHLYNITKGVYTHELAAWFTRWVQCQKFETTRSIVNWEVVSKPRQGILETALAALLAAVLLGFLLTLTIVSGDFYGLANALALVVMVMGRAYMIRLNRRAIDRSILRLAPSTAAKSSKTIVVTPNSKVVTMFIPGELIVPVFARNPEVAPAKGYECAQWICWAAFAVHVVALGMACLATQIYTVVLIIGSSILLCHGWGCDDVVDLRRRRDSDGNVVRRAYTCLIGSHLKATVFEWPDDFEFRELSPKSWALRGSCNNPASEEERSNRRMDLYAWLDLSKEQERSLVKWDLIPHHRKGDGSWGTEFKAKQKLIRELQPSILQIMDDAINHRNDNNQGREKLASDCEAIIEISGTASAKQCETQTRQRPSSGVSAEAV